MIFCVCFIRQITIVSEFRLRCNPNNCYESASMDFFLAHPKSSPFDPLQFDSGLSGFFGPGKPNLTVFWDPPSGSLPPGVGQAPIPRHKPRVGTRRDLLPFLVAPVHFRRHREGARGWVRQNIFKEKYGVKNPGCRRSPRVRYPAGGPSVHRDEYSGKEEFAGFF